MIMSFWLRLLIIAHSILIPLCWSKFSDDCNWTRTQNHSVRKRTLNHLAKLMSRTRFRVNPHSIVGYNLWRFLTFNCCWIIWFFINLYLYLYIHWSQRNILTVCPHWIFTHLPLFWSQPGEETTPKSHLRRYLKIWPFPPAVGYSPPRYWDRVYASFFLGA